MIKQDLQGPLCVTGFRCHCITRCHRLLLHGVAGQIESALMERDPQGPLCDLIQMLLCALFNLQEEEAEEYQELEKEEKEEVEKKPTTIHTGTQSGDESVTVDSSCMQLCFGPEL